MHGRALWLTDELSKLARNRLETLVHPLTAHMMQIRAAVLARVAESTVIF
jgi:hypothetical protein